jgi:hypothetical protein
MRSFKLRDKEAPFLGRSGADFTVKLTPTLIVAIFGQPDTSDEYKVTGEYTFDVVGVEGACVSFYDWKMTTAYHGDEDEDGGEWDSGIVPTPEDLWSSDAEWEFNVGGTDKGKKYAEEFVTWIRNQTINSLRFIKED